MGNAWSKAKDQLVEAIDFLKNYSVPNSQTYLEKLFELADPNDPLVQLFHGNMQGFLGTIRANPHVLFGEEFNNDSLIKYFIEHDDYAKILEDILAILVQVDDLKPRERTLLLPLLCQEINLLNERQLSCFRRLFKVFRMKNNHRYLIDRIPFTYL